VFTAEDILVRPYGDTAVLTFRLVEHDPDGKADGVRFTFPRKNGEIKSGSFLSVEK
jgi:hypothetical protein